MLCLYSTELGGKSKPVPAPAKPEAENKNERMMTMTPMTTGVMSGLSSIRTLPKNARAFDALPQAQQQAIMADAETKQFIANVRALRGVNTSVTGADLAIPVNILPVINENRFRYSKLMNRVMVRNVRGEVHQPVGGLNPEAVWEECCDALNELNFSYSMFALTCHKVGGFVLICNSLLQETDINLLADLIEMISEAIGKAKDKAILYGKGPAFSMPSGIVPRLAQESKPDGYPATAPAWVDLHSTHIITIDGTLTGAAFWAALRVAAGNTFTRYARGEVSWVMNSKTYALLESKAIATTVTGEWVAIIGGNLPIVSGQIDVLEFMPDGDIVGGYFGLYLWAQHDSAFIGTEGAGFTLRVKDATLVFGRERADGLPIIPEGFVAINIAGNAVTTTMDFPGNTAKGKPLSYFLKDLDNGITQISCENRGFRRHVVDVLAGFGTDIHNSALLGDKHALPVRHSDNRAVRNSILISFRSYGKTGAFLFALHGKNVSRDGITIEIILPLTLGNSCHRMHNSYKRLLDECDL